MPEIPRFYAWPMANDRTLALAILLLVGLFAGAVCLELHRRRRDRKLRLEAEWRAMRDLCRDRDVPDEEWKLLKGIVSQYAPEAPYHAVTRRRVFDECMGRYFKALRATAPLSEVQLRGLQFRDVRILLGLDYLPLGQRIQSTRELRLGHSIWGAHASGHEPRWFHFAVAAVDEAFFALELVGADAAPDFAPGDILKLRLWREDDARYVFDAPLFAVTEDPARWIVEHVETLTRNQARAHYRVRFDEAVTISVLNASLQEDYTDLDHRPVVTQLRGRVTSLSGGGVAVAFQQPVPKQVLLRVPLSLANHPERLTAYVRPVATQPLPGGRSLLRGKFVAMDEEVREIITRYIFLKQKQSTGEDRVAP